MSYDLSLRPTPGDTTALPSRERVTTVLIEAGARASRDGGNFEMSDRVAGEVTIDPVAGPEGIARIDVSTSSTIGTPSDLYRLCAEVSRDLGWKAYDPQGDSWLSPNALNKAAADEAADVPDTRVGVGTLFAGALFVAAAFVWAIKGARVSSLWFWAVCALGVLTLGVRLHEWRRFRGRNRRAV